MNSADKSKGMVNAMKHLRRVLDTIGDHDALISYERVVPFVDVADELYLEWMADVHFVPKAAKHHLLPEPMVEKLSAFTTPLAAYSKRHNRAGCPPIAVVLTDPAWIDLQYEALDLLDAWREAEQDARPEE